MLSYYISVHYNNIVGWKIPFVLQYVQRSKNVCGDKDNSTFMFGQK